MGFLEQQEKMWFTIEQVFIVSGSGVSHHTNDNVYMLHLTGSWSRVKSLCNVKSCVSPTRAGPQQEQLDC